MLAANPWPTIRNPMPRTNALCSLLQTFSISNTAKNTLHIPSTAPYMHNLQSSPHHRECSHPVGFELCCAAGRT